MLKLKKLYTDNKTSCPLTVQEALIVLGYDSTITLEVSSVEVITLDTAQARLILSKEVMQSELRYCPTVVGYHKWVLSI